MTKLSEIKQSVSGLTPKQLLKLDVWLHELLASAELINLKSIKTNRQVLEKHTTANRTYQLEGVRCGKKNCHCVEGKPHGPYWYAYWTEGGRTKSQYVGKKLPRNVRKT
jgi:hypothetical protein